MTVKSPMVSVIIPSYNSGNYISATLESVLKQSYQEFEIIIVDDGSTDNTLEVVKKIAITENRIKVFTIQHSGRPSVPRNYGVKNASGNFIAFLDSDDLWTKHKLKYQVTYLLNHPGEAFVYSMCFTFGDVNFFSENYELLPLPFHAAKDNKDLINIGNTIPLSSVLVRKKVLDDVGGFDEDPELNLEDFDLWLRLSKKNSFHFIPRIHVYYRIHPLQFSADWKTRENRLRFLARKRNLELPKYRNYRRKGFALLLIRNTIHFLFYILYKIIGYIDYGDNL